MPAKIVRREVDVRTVQCDWLTLDERGDVVERCETLTSEFLPDVADTQGGPVLMDVRWLQLRTGGIKQWYFCSHAHLAGWVTGPGVDVLNHGVQPLTTIKTRSQT